MNIKIIDNCTILYVGDISIPIIDESSAPKAHIQGGPLGIVNLQKLQ